MPLEAKLLLSDFLPKKFTVPATGTERDLAKTQHPFTIKSLNKLGEEGNFFNLRKGSIKNAHG